MSIDFQKELNSSQFKAVSTIDKPILVIAGAGSGKTRVIEYKTLYLIDQNIDPASILLLTFTKKAAAQMLQRVARHDPSCQQIDGGTFHSFAFKILKRYAKVIGFNNSFSILDSSDANEIIAKCVTQLNFDNYEKRFPKNDTIKTIISKAVNKQISIKTILEKEYPQFEEFDIEIKRLQEKYSQYKLQGGYVDYDDLLILLRLLLQNNEIRQKIASQYKYVMVDEYQDTNKLQGDITYLLAESHNKIMAVGDDAQSIYGFRGANHENIMQFPTLFSQCEIIKLEKNYRSTQSILDVGNAILDNMSNKFEKKLTAAKEGDCLKPQLKCFATANDEAIWIAQNIKTMRDEGINLSRQAVLFRSAYISIPLQAELNRLNIPFQVVGGLKFYETAHVKDMVALLKIFQNHRDELAWGRVLRMIEGIGPKTIEKITSSFENTLNLDQILEVLEREFANGFKYSPSIRRLVDTYRLINFDEVTVYELFEVLLKYYLPFLKKQFDEWHLRLNDLEFLQTLTSDYKSLEQFLVDLALEPPQQGVAGIDPSVDDEKPLTLSTIHSAKGLEWDVVFVIGLIDGVLPSKFSVKYSDQLEEEHRLFYVAVTRAKDYLYLTMHHEGTMGGMYQFNRISRFIENPNILEKLDQPTNKPQKPVKKIKLLEDELTSADFSNKKALFEKINNFWKK
jgi:DNA helicase-2/ATP-dependent DNA helicase PcrA